MRYDGWNDEFDEVVALNSGRVAPLHTYTQPVKCWVKYLNWPWWPAIVRSFLRTRSWVVLREKQRETTALYLTHDHTCPGNHPRAGDGGRPSQPPGAQQALCQLSRPKGLYVRPLSLFSDPLDVRRRELTDSAVVFVLTVCLICLS